MYGMHVSSDFSSCMELALQRICGNDKDKMWKTSQFVACKRPCRKMCSKKKKKTTASNVPIVAIDVTTSLSLTGNRDWVLCIEYEVFI